MKKVKLFYSNSCSRFLKVSELKKSDKEISNPSHKILIVVMPGLLLLPYKIFFNEEREMPERVASLLIVIFFSLHNS